MSNVDQLIIEESFINGKWIKGKNTFEVINPATKQVISNVANLTIEDVKQAINYASHAWLDWKNTTAQFRGDLLMRWFNLIIEHKDELAKVMTLESGKPLSESHAEITYGSSFVSWFAEEGKRAYGETIPSSNPTNRIVTIKQSIGVVAAITPWNFPLAMITRKVSPALAAGCTVVLRPASETPLTALALARLGEKAGFPAGVFNVITGKDSSGMGRELSMNDLVRKLSFTGSTDVGRTLMAQAAGTIKKISLELGGNAPFLVFDDADIDKAIEGAITAKYRNSGQSCVAANRFLVQDKVYEEFSTKLAESVGKLKTGNGLDKGVNIGPLINSAGLRKVEAHVKDAVNKGAKILTGGTVMKDLFFEPTVLVDVPVDALIAKEETFGPVASLFRFKTEEEGIEMANNTEFGLVAYFYSKDINRCWRVSEAIETGMVGINTGLVSIASAPFGGIKQSGLGREGSKHGLDEFTEIKYLCFGLNTE
jgi:succinate-semialdehyde dehydrogenase/glutarate-semialdehyde dehydrogenase